jgi:predicted TPR repeat methyltransferase
LEIILKNTLESFILTIEVNRSPANSEWDSFTEDRYLQMIKYARNKNSILDLGCNTGKGGPVIKAKYPSCKMDGVDIVSERIEKIPAGIYREIYCESVEKVNFGSRKYDAILAGEFAEHISTKIFEEILYVLKKTVKS